MKWTQSLVDSHNARVTSRKRLDPATELSRTNVDGPASKFVSL